MSDSNDWSEDSSTPQVESYSPDELTDVGDGFQPPESVDGKSSRALLLILFGTALVVAVAVGALLVLALEPIPEVDVKIDAPPPAPQISPEAVGRLGPYAQIGMPMSELEQRTSPTDTPGVRSGRPVFARLTWECDFFGSDSTDQARLTRFECVYQPLTEDGFRSFASISKFARAKYGAPTATEPDSVLWAIDEVVMSLERDGDRVALDVGFELK